MGKPYAAEMAALGQTLHWASLIDIAPYTKALLPSRTRPIVSVGSGGSLSACHLMVSLHRRFANQPARVATPLEFLQEGAAPTEVPWFISASGSNSDIVNAFELGVRSEPRSLGVLCAHPASKLAEAARRCAYCELAAFELATGRDGFLATNTLMAFCVLLARAYRAIFLDDWAPYTPTSLLRGVAAGTLDLAAAAKGQVDEVLERRTVIVLHGAATRAGAYDIESRFTETALVSVQLADYRNFAHGRHYWLARHPAETAVLALVSGEERELATRTLNAVPEQIPKTRFDLSDHWEEAGLEALAVSQRLAQRVGGARQVDPGQPGVPEFGHHIYELAYSPREQPAIAGLDSWKSAVLLRKSGQSVDRLQALGTLSQWLKDLDAYKLKLENIYFRAIILDYDGTLVRPTRRTAPPEPEVAKHLVRLLDQGALITIATGRGVSARVALRDVIPKHHWEKVIVGYYNGAEILTLADDSLPARDAVPCDELADVARALSQHRELSLLAKQTLRAYQITLEPLRVVEEMLLWTMANDVVQALGIPGVRVVRSSHSADVLAPNASKRNVVEYVRIRGGGQALCIGDSGCWPGNDYELLSEEYSLSVDEVSQSSDRCWNLASPGARGVQATLEYLAALALATTGQLTLKLG